MATQDLPDDETARPAREQAAAIGARLAAHRRRREIGVSALAREVGVSASLISQIERGQSRPSVATLLALAEALDVPLDSFFRDSGDADDNGGADATGGPQPAGVGFASLALARSANGSGHRGGPDRYLVRSGERAAIDIEGGVRWERLTPTQLREVEFMELVYSPGAESHASLYRHPGMEMVLVLEGRLDIFVGTSRHELEAGDSLCFSSRLPHRYVNPTEVTTRAVTAILREGSS